MGLVLAIVAALVIVALLPVVLGGLAGLCSAFFSLFVSLPLPEKTSDVQEDARPPQ